jgi:Ca2+/Na+ antiporter
MNQHGKSLYKQGQYQAARSEFERALMDRPYSADYAYNVAASMDQMGDHQAAEKMYRHALTLDPSHQPSYHGMAAMLVEEGRNDEAQDLITTWSATQPYSSDATVELGWLKGEMGDVDGANQEFQKALQENPRNTRALKQMARANRKAGLPGEAAANYARALYMDPDLPEAKDELAQGVQPADPAAWDSHWAAQLGLIAAGLAALVVGSDLLVQAAISVAKALGVSDLVIGLTIVAAGTSMPEVATSISAAIKGERDIAVGNVVGSNTFNILGCLGLSGLVSGDVGLVMAPSVLAFDIWVMLAVALACLPVFMTGREIARWEGGVFLGYYVAYVAYLILAAQQHDALPAFSGLMLGFVVPLTLLTLVVMVVRRPAAPGAPGAP